MVYSQPCVSANCGKTFRVSLRKPSPNIQNKSKRAVRLVPAFTIQALQCGTKVKPPPRCDVYAPNPSKATQFRVCYLRGEFPISIEFSQGGRRVGWKAPLEKLDYHHYLPMFFEGLAESQYPYYFFVQEGIKDMVQKCPYKVLPVVPQLIIPIKGALNTKRLDVMCNTVKALQMLVISCERVGEALVPYYRQILPILNLFKEHNCNIGDGIDHTATKRANVGDLIQETLQMLERYGGVDAFINIKYMVPTYESCLLN